MFRDACNLWKFETSSPASKSNAARFLQMKMKVMLPHSRMLIVFDLPSLRCREPDPMERVDYWEIN